MGSNADDAVKTCGNCKHYLRSGACKLVEGAIDPRYWCKLFSAKR